MLEMPTDQSESTNRAYDPEYRAWRNRLLRVAQREWKLKLTESPETPPDRQRRIMRLGTGLWGLPPDRQR